MLRGLFLLPLLLAGSCGDLLDGLLECLLETRCIVEDGLSQTKDSDFIFTLLALVGVEV